MLLLQCTAKGYPRPAISWSHSDGRGRGITSSVATTDAEGFLISTSMFMIQMAHRNDAGEYMCNASNMHGTMLQNYSITVDCEL